MTSDLERTRLDLPHGTQLLVGRSQEIHEMMREGTVRAVGKYAKGPNGLVSVPVVYVSRRSKPFYVRNRWALVAIGGLLLLTALVAAAVVWVGPTMVLFGALLAAFTVGTLARWSKGGGRSDVAVVTTTSVRVRSR